MSLKSCLSTIHARPSAINVAYGEVKLTLESLIPKNRWHANQTCQVVKLVSTFLYTPLAIIINNSFASDKAKITTVLSIDRNSNVKCEFIQLFQQSL